MSKKTAIIIVAIIAAALAVAGVVLIGGPKKAVEIPGTPPTPSNTPSAEPSPTTPPPDVTIKKETLWMDGWSVATILGKNPVYADEATDITKKMEFVPASEEDLSWLKQNAPEVLKSVTGRMISAQGPVTCDTSGCMAGKQKLEDSYYLQPDTIPGFGEIYEQWGITDTLFKVNLEVGDSRGVTLLADGYEGLYVEFPTDQQKSTVEEEDDSIIQITEPRKTLFGAGLGSFFSVNPLWSSKPETFTLYADTAPAQYTNVINEGYWKNPLIPNGLSEPVVTNTPDGPFVFFNPDGTSAEKDTEDSPGTSIDYSEFWSRVTSEQLTAYTSPVSGCAGMFICAPSAAVQAQITNMQTNTICTLSKINLKEQIALKLVSVDLDVKMQVQHKIHQLGIWNGKNPEQFDNQNGEKGLYSGTPPLVSGDEHLRIVQHWVVGGKSAPYSVIGLAGQYGKDSKEFMESPQGVAEFLQNNPKYTTCSPDLDYQN